MMLMGRHSGPGGSRGADGSKWMFGVTSWRYNDSAWHIAAGIGGNLRNLDGSVEKELNRGAGTPEGSL